MKLKSTITIGLVVLGAWFIAPTPLQADQFTASRELSWERLQAESSAFFQSLVFGGVDRDSDGQLSTEERAIAGPIRSTTAAALLIGLSCGLLGCFVTLRRMAMFGDMLGHAMLPGIALGFIVAGHKGTPALLLGALGAGLSAAWFTRFIRTHSRLKEDAALGIALTSFYALGIWLLSWIIRTPELSSKSSGLHYYLFGNPAVVDESDLTFLGIAALLVLSSILIAKKEWVVCAFDPSFATSIGLPRSHFDNALLVLLTIVVVVSIKILGVVLVAAMLILPPASAYLLTERMRSFCIVSSVIGMFSGLMGTFLSALFHVGGGPVIICVAFFILVVTFVLSPQHGVLSRYVRHRRLAERTVRENLVATAYRILEVEKPGTHTVSLQRLAAERSEPLGAVRALARRLHKSGWGAVEDDSLVLTPRGEERARVVVRKHRLWELFLSREASLPPDHVHPSAEEVEHLLSDDALAELERLLDHPERDPHGRSIPSPSAPSDKGGVS